MCVCANAYNDICHYDKHLFQPIAGVLVLNVYVIMRPNEIKFRLLSITLLLHSPLLVSLHIWWHFFRNNNNNSSLDISSIWGFYRIDSQKFHIFRSHLCMPSRGLTWIPSLSNFLLYLFYFVLCSFLCLLDIQVLELHICVCACVCGKSQSANRYLCMYLWKSKAVMFTANGIGGEKLKNSRIHNY